MTIFGLAVLFFTLLAGCSYLLFRLLDGVVLAPQGEYELLRRQALEESHIWWLTSVIYIGFTALCLFMIATAVAVELYLGNYAAFAHLLFVSGTAAVIAAVALYMLIRSFIRHFVI